MKKFLSLIFIGSFVCLSSQAIELSPEEVKTLNFLQNEAESLRFRMLFASEAAKNRALKSTNSKDKEHHLEQAESRKAEAKHGRNLGSAINKLIFDIDRQSPNYDFNNLPCPTAEIDRQKAAIDLVKKLETEGYLAAESAKEWTDRYDVSIKMMSIRCY